jgi:hypothetical protein
MRKIINAKEATELELKFDDEHSLLIVFDTEAISNFELLEGGLNSYMKEDKTPERCAKVIYIGAIARQPEFTLEDARKLVSELSPVTITEILNEFNESIGASNNGVVNEMQKKLLDRIMEKYMK